MNCSIVKYFGWGFWNNFEKQILAPNKISLRTEMLMMSRKVSLLLLLMFLLSNCGNSGVGASGTTEFNQLFNYYNNNKNNNSSSAIQIRSSKLFTVPYVTTNGKQVKDNFSITPLSKSSSPVLPILNSSNNLYLPQPLYHANKWNKENQKFSKIFRDLSSSDGYHVRPHPHLHHSHIVTATAHSHSISKRNSANLFYELQSSSSSLISSLSSSSLSSSSSSSSSSISTQQLSSSAQYMPQFTHEPYGSVKFSNLYGGIVPCSVRLIRTQRSSIHHQSMLQQQQQQGSGDGGGATGDGDALHKVYWEVRDFRTIDDSHFMPVVDVVGIREQRSDGSLAFLPFQHESSLANPELHNALYRCVVVTGVGTLISRTIHVTLTFEKSGQVVARSYDATATEGNDALLKCSVNSDLYRVVAWLSDDGELFLPFDHNTNFIPLDTRHYVLPSGDLLVASIQNSDVRKQFRCRVGHRLTGERLDSANWARIKLSDQSSHISYRPRFNLDTSLRQTLAIDDYSDSNGDMPNRASSSSQSSSSSSSSSSSTSSSGPSQNAVDLYCSFDGQPPPNISWYFIGYQDISQQPTINQRSTPVMFNISSSISSLSQTSTLFPYSSSSSLQQTQDPRLRRIVVTSRHLRIVHPTSADIGTYVCVGNNSHFEVRHETDLLLRSLLQVNLTTIVNRGQETSILAQQSSSTSSSPSSVPTPQVPLLPGDQVTLVCNLTHLLDGSIFEQVLNSRFLVSYHWYHNQVPITEIDPNQSLHQHLGSNLGPASYLDKRQTSYVLNPLRYYNSYLYNSAGTSSASSSSSSSGSSGPSVHIEKLNKNVIQIRNLRHSDTGIYQCFVRLTGPDYQEWLQASTVIQLTQRAPSFFATFDEQILIDDNELSLRCIAGGNPAPAIVWQRNNLNLTDFMGNLLTSHSGGNSGNIYRYKTTSYLVKESKILDTEFLKSSSSSNNNQQPSSSQSHFHRRDNSGNSLNNNNFVTVSYFNITSIRPQDVGLFRCTASNGAGVASHQARISVIGSPYAQPIGDLTAVVGETVTITCPYGGYPIEEVFFLKAKRRLPYDERHLITALGTLQIVQIEKNDEDEYSCVVVGGGNGQRSEQSFRLSVVSPPVLSPFMFSDALEEGMRATAVCSVISGDPPIQLQWLKDGEPISMQSSGQVTGRRADPQIQVLNIKEFISSLIITNITRRHQGWYTCLASTPSTSSNRTALMKVKAPPKWLIKPSNQFAITQTIGNGLNQTASSTVGEHVTTSSVTTNSGTVRFDCLATGNPTPVIRWKFLRPKSLATSKSRSNLHSSPDSQYDSVPILSSPQIHVLENGSLLIRSLDRAKFEGVYLCEVANGIGKPLEARASLVIYSTPNIALKISIHSSSNEQTGDSTKHYSTQSPVSNLPEENTVQLSLRRHSQVSLACSSSGSIPLSIGWYKNDHQINSFESVSLSSTNSFRILESPMKTKLSYGGGGGGGGGVSGLGSPNNDKIGERTSNLILKHLTRSDNGRYVCLTRNLYGLTFQSVMVYVLEPPDAPESLKAIEVGSRSVTLSWQVIYTGNLPIISQNIEYKQESDKTWHNALTIKSNTNTITVYGLQPLTPYEFRVSFVNELGTSDHSRSITLTTQMEAPTVMPDSLRATALSTHTIRLTWSLRMPSQHSDIEVIDGFYIGYRALSTQGSQQSSGPSSSSPSSSSYTYKTISNSPMQHLYSKLSSSSANLGSHSQPPQPFTRLKSSSQYSSSSTASFLIKLQQTQSDQPNSIGYLDQRGSSGSSGPSSSSSSSLHQFYEHNINSLQRQTQYQFVVQAFNEKGAGPASLEVIARTFSHDPPKPPNFRVENVSSHEASLIWEYTDNSNLVQHGSMSLSSSSSGQQMDSLLSASSSSSSSSSLDDDSPLLVDGYVISYHVATSISNSNRFDNMMDSSVSLSQSSSSSSSAISTQDGSSSSGNNVDDWQSVTISSPSASSFVLRNLLCGTEYTARIEAFNKMGSGKPSQQIRFATIGSVPNAPEKYSRQFIAPNITYVTINLDQWSDGGCPISGYSIKYRSRRMSHYHRSVAGGGGGTTSGSGNSGGWIPLSTHLMPEKDIIIIRDLQPGTWHDLVIAAQNDAGRREAEFSFATLTETGATVEPLHAFESRMGSSFGSASAGYGNGSVLGALFEDPMIFIPALCTVIVLLVVSSTSAFLYVMRIRHEAMQLANSEDTYCSHRSAASRSDDLSLNSYNNNGGGGGATLGNNGKLCSNNQTNGNLINHGSMIPNGTKSASSAATTTNNNTILYDMKGISLESSEPLYEQTTNFVHPNQKSLASYHHHLQQQQQHQIQQNSPRKLAGNHQNSLLLHKQLSNENLLDYHHPLNLNSNTYGFAPSGGGNAMFGDLHDSPSHASGQYSGGSKTLGRHHHPQNNSQHLYQVPEQLKMQPDPQQAATATTTTTTQGQQLLVLNDSLSQAQAQQSQHSMMSIDAQPAQQVSAVGPGGVKMGNSYMTTFGMIRAIQQNNDFMG